jgi:hypothetical protein
MTRETGKKAPGAAAPVKAIAASLFFAITVIHSIVEWSSFFIERQSRRNAR